MSISRLASLSYRSFD